MSVVRKTKLVEAVIEHFKQSNSALSVVDLVKRFKGRANKTTIYRILDRLENDGSVHSFKGQDGLTWYAKCFSNCSTDFHKDIHPHFQCKQCGKVECLSISIVLPNIETHRIESAEMFLTGRCQECLS